MRAEALSDLVNCVLGNENLWEGSYASEFESLLPVHAELLHCKEGKVIHPLLWPIKLSEEILGMVKWDKIWIFWRIRSFDALSAPRSSNAQSKEHWPKGWCDSIAISPFITKEICAV